MKGFLLLIVLVCASVVHAQEPFVLSWSGTGTSEGGEDAVQIDSGSIFFCGFSVIDPATTKIVLTKISPGGQLQGQWSFGPEGKHVPLQMRWDNGALTLTGRSEDVTGDVDGFWLRVDTLGNQLHWSTFGTPDRNETFVSFDIDENNNYVAAGFVGALDGTGNNAYVVLFDQAFGFEWENEETYPLNDVVSGVEVIDGNQYVVAGDRLVSDYYNYYVARFDSAGNEVWEYFEPNGYNGGSKGLIVNSANEIVVIGESSGPGFIVFEPTFSRFSEDGEALLQTYLESSPSSDAAFDVLEIIPGSYMVVGYGGNPETGSTDFMVIYCDAEGNEVTRRYYSGDAGNDIAFSIAPGLDDGYVIAGRSGNPDQGFMLVYDWIPLSLSVSGGEGGQLLVYPNPVAVEQALQVPAQWAKAIIVSAEGRTTQTIKKPGQLVFRQPGIYHLQFLDAADRLIGQVRVVVQ